MVVNDDKIIGRLYAQRDELKARLAETERERDALRLAVQRWKVEELLKLQCQCAKPREFDLNGIAWCEACERPRRWEDVKLRPDEAELMRAADSGNGSKK
jgi:hypothetical protein